MFERPVNKETTTRGTTGVYNFHLYVRRDYYKLHVN